MWVEAVEREATGPDRPALLTDNVMVLRRRAVAEGSR
jgi:hypothetical protein